MAFHCDTASAPVALVTLRSLSASPYQAGCHATPGLFRWVRGRKVNFDRRPGGEREIMAPSEGAGPGSTPGPGTEVYPWSVAEARRPAKAEAMQVRLLPGILWPNPKWTRGPAVNRDCVGSTPTGHPATKPALLDGSGTALVRRDQWVRVPPLALHDAGAGWPGGRLQPDSKQVRLLPASLTAFRMWESLAIRRLGVPESVGSNPTILTVIAL
jgi:hypothetical protein